MSGPTRGAPDAEMEMQVHLWVGDEVFGVGVEMNKDNYADMIDGMAVLIRNQIRMKIHKEVTRFGER